MSFNFGEEKFRHSPVDDYIGISAAPESVLISNDKSGNSVAVRKVVPNAPQALIIEVGEFAFDWFQSLYLYFLALSRTGGANLEPNQALQKTPRATSDHWALGSGRSQ